MLLSHAWLAPMIKPETITEEDEDEVAEAEAADGGVAAGDQGPAEPSDDVIDKEVADWVKDAIDKRRRGVLGKAPKPALHAAPLDAVSSPSQDGAPNGLDAAGAAEVPTT